MTPLLFNVPTDRGSWLLWGAVHQSDHFQIVAGIRDKTGVTVGVLPIDPVPLDNKEAMLAWFMNHQDVHNQMNSAIGVGGVDLSYFDFKSKEQTEQWIRYHAYEHQIIAFRIAAFQFPQTAQGQPTEAVQPQPEAGLQPAEQPQGNQALLPQGSPGVQTILSQPVAGTQVSPQGGSPQAALQPFPTLNPQPGLQPGQTLSPGTPLTAGSGGTSP